MTDAGRKLSNWIETYQEYTKILPSPLLFRKWVAIFFVAAAVERKIWCRTMGSDLYPNLYVILVGPPGIGKGQAIYLGERLIRDVPNIHIGPSDMTAASLIDALSEAVRRLVLLGSVPFVEFNSLTVISRELGVLIPSWDASFMNNLTDIYDGLQVDQKRRGKDLHIKIASPQINLLGACTPSYLNQVMPAGAWDQGFISRTLMIYSGDRIQQDPFAASIDSLALHGDLLEDLKNISLEYGRMQFTPESIEAIQAWAKSGFPPEPTHQRLQFYNARRLAHLLKLCMISSIARSSAKVIELEHYSEALDWLVEAETYMPDIFKSMVTGGDSSAMEETWNYVWTLYAKENKPISEHRIVHFLRERVPAHAVMRILDVMVRANMFKVELGDKGFQGYSPTSRETRLG
jgi:Protein of unknown function (DUF3987)